nr:MAG TPA: hypothetical protein [Caudoviricetes sp.]
MPNVKHKSTVTRISAFVSLSPPPIFVVLI